MIPVYQTIDGPDGNCFAACVASILEINIEDVPEFQGWDGLRQWLRGRGWLLDVCDLEKIVSLGFGDLQQSHWNMERNFPGYAIASVKTLTGIHAVVCVNGKIVHDPSPRPWANQSDAVILWSQLRRC